MTVERALRQCQVVIRSRGIHIEHQGMWCRNEASLVDEAFESVEKAIAALAKLPEDHVLRDDEDLVK
jgi:hypothetical protein